MLHINNFNIHIILIFITIQFVLWLHNAIIREQLVIRRPECDVNERET